MKFVSKQSNLRVVLKPGIPREPLSGREAVPGIYVKFEDGIANVTNDNIIEMMKNHPGFDRDFIVLDEAGNDPFQSSRKKTEPDHNVMEINYGHVGKNLNPKPSVTFSPDQKKVIDEMIKKAVSEAAVPLATSMVKELVEQARANTEASDTAETTTEAAEVATEEVKTNKGKTTGKAAK